MSTEYTDLKIVDCNRLHSIQARSGNDSNKALFTNELGKGIKLKVGDRVSVKGAYISEVGAGADTVELKGTNTGERRTVEFTLEEGKHKVSLEDSYTNGSDALPLITEFQHYTVSASNLTYDIKDNETYITIQYYLNNSGDSGYLSLPRRFASLLSSEEDNSHYTNLDKLDQGRPYQEVHEGQFVSDDYMYYDNSTDATGSGFNKLRTDCSRFTLMKRNGSTPLRRETVLDPSFPAENIDNGFPPELYYLMGSKYQTFKQLIKISVRDGFNSPDSISEEITRQLKEASTPYDFEVKYQDTIRPVSQYYTTETFKPQLCGSNFTMEEKQYEFFTYNRNASSIETLENRKEKAWAYWSNYYNVYHKRPEIREAGQNLNNLWGSNIHNRNTIYEGEQSSATIILSLEYNETNLKNLSNLFKSQKLYPELFSNDNAQKIQSLMKRGVLEARYLHMNTQYSSTRNASLGGDNIDFNASYVNNQSLPLFIEYQPQNEDKETGGYDRLNLSYGFATRYEDGGKYYIRLFTERIGGMNQALFRESEGSSTLQEIEDGTIIGYDHNYNAYGTACLMGYSGRLRYDYATINEWGTGDKNLWKQEKSANNPNSLGTARYMRYNYVGCNNPVFKYDPENTRFFFSQLHTPELAGQEWISAGDNGSGISPAIEDNTQNGGNVVYKINKRMNPYSYTPDMKPYEYDMSITYDYGHSGTKREISKPNRSIYPWAIFDSQSGIYISDFGYDEDNWDNGLWGILGFTYNQFNKTESSNNNRLSRIINSNINDLNIPTTNADIVSSDTRNFIVNQFGAVYFTTQLPSSSTLDDRDFLPAITNNAVSIRLLAENLPRKMLRPYYCIRSDIIDNPHYIGGENSNNELPVVAICDKQYSGGDFYFGAEGDFIFTITKEKTITNITTSIHDPDQSFSRVNSDSAVIYKIESNVVNDINIAEELMKGLKKK